VDRQQSMVAVGLEVVPGAVFQTFGVGHLYAGRVSTGLAIMISYWILQAVNAALIPFFIGWITAPLTFLAYLVFCPTNVLESRRR
jgi:TM2 domain-containing membrane protein YozV